MSDYEAFLAAKRCRPCADVSPTFGPSVDEFDAENGTSRGWHYIYGLYDPRDGRLRYIGKSDHPRARLSQHLRENRGTHRSNWVQNLRRHGLAPVMVIIDAGTAGSDWAWMECLYIAAARGAGHPLTNGTGGGEGVAGLSAETRARLAKAARGRQHTAETRARMSAAKRGRAHTEEWKQRMREICAGRPLSRECAEANRRRMQKLTDAQVREVRRRVAAGERRVLVARDYGVSTGTIRNIVIGRTYGHVPNEVDHA